MAMIPMEHEGGVLKSGTFTNVSVSSTGSVTILTDTTKKKIIVAVGLNSNLVSGYLSTFYVGNANNNTWFTRIVKVDGGVVKPDTSSATVSGTYYYIEMD